MRQGTGISKDMGHFKGTDNARIEETLKEADDFAHRLKSYRKHLTESSQALDGRHLDSATGSVFYTLVATTVTFKRPPRPAELFVASSQESSSLPP